MKTLIPSKLFHTGFVLLACAAGLLAREAVAQNTLPAIPQVAIQVQPLVADVAVARKIIVAGTWPDACAPVSATLDTKFSELTRTIVVQLLTPPTLVACAQVPTPYTYELPYVPAAKGVTTILAYTNTGGSNPGALTLRTTGRVVVAPADTVWSGGDIGGAWYDPATNGSGLTFVHNYLGNDGLFGTWYLYDSQGLPRWYTLQEGKWSKNGTVVEGKLFESRGAACPQVVLYCPTTSVGAATEIGLFRATFSGLGSVLGPPNLPAKIEAIAPNGAVLFSSNIQRLQF